VGALQERIKRYLKALRLRFGEKFHIYDVIAVLVVMFWLATFAGYFFWGRAW
jgi:hypothetical protein